jgi:hypothetical protein
LNLITLVPVAAILVMSVLVRNYRKAHSEA